MTATDPTTTGGPGFDPTSEELKALVAEAANRLAGRPSPPTAAAAPELLPAHLGPDAAQRWARDGYLVLPGAVPADACDRIDAEAIGHVRTLAETGEGRGGYRAGDGMVSVPEPNLAAAGDASTTTEDHVSKLFNLHRRGTFADVAADPDLVAVLRGLLGPDVDCFNSQFIFKNPGAWGQPWHQDSLYFAFDRVPQVGVWVATSEATAANGCLFVAPGSHTEPLHHHVPDRRPGANLGYLEIVDFDFSDAVAVEMSPGDVLVFHSFLMHRSGDNATDGRRTAYVCHYASRGTTPLGTPSGTVDFLPVS